MHSLSHFYSMNINERRIQEMIFECLELSKKTIRTVREKEREWKKEEKIDGGWERERDDESGVEKMCAYSM